MEILDGEIKASLIKVQLSFIQNYTCTRFIYQSGWIIIKHNSKASLERVGKNLEKLKNSEYLFDNDIRIGNKLRIYLKKFIKLCKVSFVAKRNKLSSLSQLIIQKNLKVYEGQIFYFIRLVKFLYNAIVRVDISQ